jgi:hypothetical protein
MLTGPGNPNLRPERSREMEGGIDIGMLHTRVNLELTAYTKHTKDALINRSLGLTLNNWSWQENLGDVLNTGVEATLQAIPIQTDAVTWNFTLNASHNRNELQRLAPDVIGVDVAGNQRFVVGYPLYGYWAPRATFEDANHDGIIAPNEIQIADTAMYIGTNLPKVETSLASQIDLFHGILAIGTLFDSRWGDIVQNSSRNYSGLSLYEQNDSSAPLWEQARAVAWRMRFGSTSLNFEKGWFVRFRELSLTYTPPGSWLRRLGGRTVSVTTAVRNLGLWSHYSGADPEVSSVGAFFNTNTFRYESNAELRTDNGTVPLPRTWVVRCNIGL